MTEKLEYHFSFDFKVGPTNDTQELPEAIFRTLSTLYEEGYLTIEPTKVVSRYYKNYKGLSMYSVDMDFYLPDNTIEENK